MISSNRKQGRRVERPSKFSADTLEKFAQDLMDGTIPLDRLTVSDEQTAGLRAIVRNTGNISFHVNYTVGGVRPYFKIGDYPAMSVAKAREMAGIIKYHAERGVDVQEGMHDRLIKELFEKKTRWKP